MKLDRLLAITMLLLNHRRVGAQELAERFEVSLRTIYRDLETINQAGIPIASFAGAHGGYEIMESYRLERQMLSVEELHSIITALQGVRFAMDDREFGQLMDKVGALVAKSERDRTERMKQELIIDMNPWQHGRDDLAKLGELRQAIRSSKLVQFEYTASSGADSLRICEPQQVVLKGYVWYLYGYCRLRSDYRIFRLSRIQSLTLLEERFERRDGQVAQLHFGMMQRGDYPIIKLRLRFQPKAKAKVRDYFAAHAIEEEPGGTLLVISEQPDEPWLYTMLLSYGSDVQILEPASVIEIVVERAKEIIRLYEHH